MTQKCASLFVHGHDVFQSANSFLKAKLKKTVSFEEQIMSKNKYISIFLHQMEAIVFSILQYFCNTLVKCL